MGAVRPQVVLFGDSLTEQGVQVGSNTGWVASLTNYYSRKADVVVRGYGGYNTRLARLMLDKIFPIPSSNAPLLVIVFFGANDAAIPDSRGQGILHVPLEEYRENTQAIVAHLKKQSDATKIILITPPPVCEKALQKKALEFGDHSGVSARRNEVTKLYAEECVKVGQETNVPVIDLWSSFQDSVDWSVKYLRDGLHLGPGGNAKVYEELLKILDAPGSVPTLKADEMRYDFPFWIDFGSDPTAVVAACITQSTS